VGSRGAAPANVALERIVPRYYFHTAGDGQDRDDEGVELATDAAARVEAIQFAGAVMRDQPDVLWDGREFRVFVTNEWQALLFTIVMKAIDEPREDQAAA
jgi:hypothetical protein